MSLEEEEGNTWARCRIISRLGRKENWEIDDLNFSSAFQSSCHCWVSMTWMLKVRGTIEGKMHYCQEKWYINWLGSEKRERASLNAFHARFFEESSTSCGGEMLTWRKWLDGESRKNRHSVRRPTENFVARYIVVKIDKNRRHSISRSIKKIGHFISR